MISILISALGCALALATWLLWSRAKLRREFDAHLAMHGEAAEQLTHAGTMWREAEAIRRETEIFAEEIRTRHEALETELAEKTKALISEAEQAAEKILAEAAGTAGKTVPAEEKQGPDGETATAEAAGIIARAREEAEAIESAARMRAREQGYRPYGVDELERIRAANAALVDDLSNVRSDNKVLSQENSLLRGKLTQLRAETDDNEWWKDRHDKLVGALDTAERQISALTKTGAEASDLRKSLTVVSEKLICEVHSTLVREMTSNNFASSRGKLDATIAFLSRHKVTVNEDSEALHTALRKAFEKAAREEALREEQRRIKAMMREELALQRERDAELKRLEAQESAVRRALDVALAKAEHSEEVDRLRERLAELDGAIVRAKSQAELTKAGHVYVLSNIGSFGEGVFKVGMTRRLEPLERVTELGDASVPFPFDVHMMISCEDAPALETALHRALNAHRLNKVNLRKEFFRTNLTELARIVEVAHGKVEYIAEPAALQYRDSQSMTDADFAFVATEQSAALAEDLSEN